MKSMARIKFKVITAVVKVIVIAIVVIVIIAASTKIRKVIIKI